MIVSLLTLGLLLIPSSNAFFRLPCAKPVLDARVDPIVSPGRASSHAHSLMGSNGIGLSTTFNDLRNSECTTCMVKDDKSAYWVSELYYQYPNGSFQVVTHGGMIVYYLQRNAANETVEAFPDGLRMLTGNPYLRSKPDGTPEARAITWKCIDFNGPDRPEASGFPNTNCPGSLRAQVFFPACWDGVNLDSPDHKSHMAYPDGVDNGQCPYTHPHHLVSIFYEVWFNVGPFSNLHDGGQLVLANGDPTGYGLHADFANGWDHDVLSRAVKTCTASSGVIEDCPVFKNEGRFVSNADMNSCSAPNPFPNELVAPPNALLPYLPGCVAVTKGPAPATAADLVPGCVSGSGNPVPISAPPQNTSTSMSSSSMPPHSIPPASPPPSPVPTSVNGSSPNSSASTPLPSPPPSSNGVPSSSTTTTTTITTPAPPSVTPSKPITSSSPTSSSSMSSSSKSNSPTSSSPTSSSSPPPPVSSPISSSGNGHGNPSTSMSTSTTSGGPASQDPGSVSPKPTTTPPTKGPLPSSSVSSKKPEPSMPYHHHHHHHHHHHQPQKQEHQHQHNNEDEEDCDEQPPPAPTHKVKNASVPMRRRHHARRAGHGSNMHF